MAAWSKELSDQPVARTLLDEPVVLFRTADGQAVALEDWCCYRNPPLSHGRVEGNTIACGYHGMVYEPGGRCIRVPGQDSVPPDASVRSFPVVERDNIVWLWPGDAGKADAAQVPGYPVHNDGLWAHQTGHYLINGNHELINDNLIDLSPVGYVHGKTIGGTPAAHSEASMKTERTPDGVVVRRWMPGAASL